MVSGESLSGATRFWSIVFFSSSGETGDEIGDRPVGTSGVEKFGRGGVVADYFERLCGSKKRWKSIEKEAEAMM